MSLKFLDWQLPLLDIVEEFCLVFVFSLILTWFLRSWLGTGQRLFLTRCLSPPSDHLAISGSHLRGSPCASPSHSSRRQQVTRSSPLPAEPSRVLKLLIHAELSDWQAPRSSPQTSSLGPLSVCSSGSHNPQGPCPAASSPGLRGQSAAPHPPASVSGTHRPENLYILRNTRKFKLLLSCFNVSADMKPEVLLIKPRRFLCQEHSWWAGRGITTRFIFSPFVMGPV